MSTLTMASSSVRSFSREIFSKRQNFSRYLNLMKVVELKRSAIKKLPFLESPSHTIWISNKLKPLFEKNPKEFGKELKSNGSAYEIGLTIPSAEYPTASWILYKKGEGNFAETIASIVADDTDNGEVVDSVKP